MFATVKENARLAAIGLFGREYTIFDLIDDYANRHNDDAIVVDFDLHAKARPVVAAKVEQLAA